MMSLCQKLNVTVGDFGCRDKIIAEAKIAAILKVKRPCGHYPV